MSIPLSGYYNRHDPDKNFEKHLFRAGYVLQSAEMNEIQEHAIYRSKMLGDALFRDGDIIRDCRIVIDSVTGATQCEGGAIYLRGAVRGVPPANITIPVVGTIAVGIRLVETTITENEDPTLREPAAETRNYQEPGAGRLKVEPRWGYDGDGGDGEFFPIYVVDDGQVRAKEPPPQLDSVSQAIARYDRDSAGSNYIVSGMRVTKMTDLGNGRQMYNVQDGRARVNGFAVNLTASRRLEYEATPDLRFIDSEPFTSVSVGTQRVNVDRAPISSITQVRITAQKTEAIVHATFTGAQDPLPDSSVVDIISVTQGATTFVKNVDYKLTAGRVDWSLPGNEPAPGSTYQCTYQHIATVTPTAVDDEGFSVTGAVVGTLVMTSYYVKLPRIDRLCITEDGQFVWIKGVATDYNPVRPSLPNNICPLAQVYQTWTDDRLVVNDGVRVVPMSDIEAMNARMDQITDLVAQQKLVSDINVREAATKKGLFVDPFLDDQQRDQGIAQTAAVFDGVLTLPIGGNPIRPSADVSAPAGCAYTLVPVLSQNSRTGVMKINPYMAFGILPSPVTLNPPMDQWTEVQTEWTSSITRTFFSITGSGPFWRMVSRAVGRTTEVVKTETAELSELRQIEIRFQVAGFGPGETLNAVTFDGIPVTPIA